MIWMFLYFEQFNFFATQDIGVPLCVSDQLGNPSSEIRPTPSRRSQSGRQFSETSTNYGPIQQRHGQLERPFRDGQRQVGVQLLKNYQL